MAKRSPKSTALGSREYSKFREVIDGEYVVATSNEDASIFPASLNATASGETSVLSAPGVNKALKIKYLMANNSGDSQLAVSFREGTGGDDKFKNSMPQYGSMWNANLMNTAWLLKENTALLVNLGGAGNVNVQVGYEVVPVSSAESFTEAVGIDESMETVYVEGE